MLLNRLITIFEWENLPETIDTNFLNTTLFTIGRVFWCKINGKLYALNGDWGGEPNEYYKPTRAIIANPVLGSHDFELDKNAVMMINSDIDLIPSSQISGGLFSLISRTSQLLSDTDTSLDVALVNSRLFGLPVANTEQAKISIDSILRDVYDGKSARVATVPLVDNFQYLQNSQMSQITNLLREYVEIRQYYLADFYHSIGVDSNYNLKRERLNTAEVETNDSALMININDMLICRQNAVNAINDIFGTSINVKLSPEWDKKLNGGDTIDPIRDNSDMGDSSGI